MAANIFEGTQNKFSPRVDTEQFFAEKPIEVSWLVYDWVSYFCFMAIKLIFSVILYFLFLYLTSDSLLMNVLKSSRYYFHSWNSCVSFYTLSTQNHGGKCKNDKQLTLSIPGGVAHSAPLLIFFNHSKSNQHNLFNFCDF